MKEYARELKSAEGRAAGEGKRGPRGDRQDAATGSRDGQAGSRHRQELARQPQPKTWYGMPAYAKDGKAVVFFRGASKFKERYAMLGFQDLANLDEGSMWPIAYALTKLTAADEKKIAALVKRAVS